MIYKTLLSSCIDYVGYNAATLVMEVCFCTSGLYTLTNVPEYHFTGICNAPSAGGYWNEHLKGKY